MPEIRRYGFCKFFDFSHLSEFHGLLAQVFDHFSDAEENAVEDLKNMDWLFGPRSMHKWPDLRKDTGWKSLGILSAAKDETVPDFKGVQAFPYIVEDESKIGPWYPIHHLVERGENCKYEMVQHLETKILTTKKGLVDRAGMEYCRISELKIEEYHNLAEKSVLYMYLQMINTPLYKNIPKEVRGRALADTSQTENI
jgi:hypothetical protein